MQEIGSCVLSTPYQKQANEMRKEAIGEWPRIPTQ